MFSRRTILIVLFLFTSYALHAAAKTWVGNTTDWNTAGNWSPSGVPLSGDDVTIPTSPSGGSMPLISSGTFTIKTLTIQSAASLTQTGGTFSVLGGATSITGTFNQSGGTYLSNNTLTVNSNGFINISSGTIHMADATNKNPSDNIIVSVGGTINQTGGIIALNDITTNSGSPNGTYTQTNGTLKMYDDFRNNGIFNSTGGLIEFAGSGSANSFPITVQSTNTQFYNVLINSGVDCKIGANQACSINVSGNWTNHSTATPLDAKASTVIFNGSGNQVIGGTEPTKFRNFTMNKSGGILSFAANQSINNGDLTLTAGTFDIAAYTFNRQSAGGTFTISNGALFRLSGNTGGQTGSNFPLNYSTLSFTTLSNVEYYDGNSVAQTVYGGVNYGNLIITNSYGVTLNSNITVNNTLTLNSGKITIPTGYTLNITSGNAVGGSGFGASKHIVTAVNTSTGAKGFLRIGNITASTIFPVGNGTYYLPTTFYPTGTFDLSVCAFPGVTRNGEPNGIPFGVSAKDSVVDAVWKVNQNSGSGNGNLLVNWPAALEGSVFSTYSNSNIGVSYNSGTTWDFAIGTGDNLANTAVRAAVSSFGSFGVGKINLPLQVKFNMVNAIQNSGTIQIDWSILSEMNIEEYEIERSMDGINFSKAGEKTAKANNATSVSYNWKDFTTVSGTYYYRIKAINYDGNYFYSSIIKISIGSSAASINLYPNPVTAGFSVINASDLPKGNYKISIFNNQGQLVDQQLFSHNGGAISRSIQLTDLRKGMYYLQIENENVSITSKSLIVQ